MEEGKTLLVLLVRWHLAICLSRRGLLDAGRYVFAFKHVGAVKITTCSKCLSTTLKLLEFKHLVNGVSLIYDEMPPSGVSW